MDKNGQKRGSGWKVMISLAALVIVIGGVRAARDLLAPIMLAFFVAILSLPIMRFWRSWGIPRFLAVLLTIIADIAILSPIALVAINLTTEFKAELPSLMSELNDEMIGFQGYLKERFDYELKFDNQEVITEVKDYLLGLIGGTAAILKTFFFVLVVSIFFLMEAGGFTRKLASIRRARGPNLKRFNNTARDIQRYLGIKTMVSAFTGVCAAYFCYALGLKFYGLWGLVAFLLNYIPAIGSIIASIPPALLALVDQGAVMEPGLGLAGIVLAGYLVINMMLGNFIEPALLGARFGVSTSVVILSVLFWGWLWGLLGMFLAVPLTMLVKVVLDDSPDFRWLSIAMGKIEGRPKKEKGKDPEPDAEVEPVGKEVA